MYFKVSTHVIMTVNVILNIFAQNSVLLLKDTKVGKIFLKPSSFFVNSRDNIGILPDEKILLLKPGSLWEMM